MKKKNRDDFSTKIKNTIAARVGYKCSNPKCKQTTSGPSKADKEVTNVGVAAHITAASEHGPRYDSLLTYEERSGQRNGIWLCQKCAKAIDDDPDTYSVELLQDWKTRAEDDARDAIEKGGNNKKIKNLKLLVHNVNLA